MRNNCPSVLCYGYIRGLNEAEGTSLVAKGMMHSVTNGGRILGYYHGPRIGFFSGLAQIVEDTGLRMSDDIERFTRMFALADGLVPCDKSAIVPEGFNRVCIGTKSSEDGSDYHCAIKLDGEWWNKMGEVPAHLVIDDPETADHVAGYGNVVFYNCPQQRPAINEAGAVRTVTNADAAKTLSDDLDYLVNYLETVNFISPDEEVLESIAGRLLEFAGRNHIPLGERLAGYAPKNDRRSQRVPTLGITAPHQ